MVDNVSGNNTQKPNFLKLKGEDKKLDLNKLAGLHATNENKAIFDMIDFNKNGVIDKNEAIALQKNLQNTAGNTTLSRREAKAGHGKDMNTFDAISSLAQQQESIAKNNKYEETQGAKTQTYEKSTIDPKTGEVIKGNTQTIDLSNGYSYTNVDYKNNSQETYSISNNIGYTKRYSGIDKDAQLIKENRDNFENGSTEEIDYEKNTRTVTTKDTENKNVTTTRVYDGTDENAPLSKIIVNNNNANGQTVETRYNSEEDFKNNKPSEEIINGNNETLKQVKTFTYKDGNVKIETKGSDNSVTTTYQNDKGEEIPKDQFEDKVQEQAKENVEKKEGETRTQVVQKGDTISAIVKKALEEQGITDPTTEEITNARKEILELNKDKVKTYNGSNKKNIGNKYFIANETLQIPQFTKAKAPKAEATEEIKSQESPDNKKKPDANLDPKDKKIIDSVARFYADKLGNQYDVGYNEKGEITISQNGKKLDAASSKANAKVAEYKKVQEFLQFDVNQDLAIDIKEFKTLVYTTLSTMSGSEYPASPEIDQLIQDSFNEMNTNSNDQVLDTKEINSNAANGLNKIANDINTLEEEKFQEQNLEE